MFRLQQPCIECSKVLHLPELNRVLNKPIPPPENFVYVNNLYSHPALFELLAKCKGLDLLVKEKSPLSPLLRYAQGVSRGKFEDNKILSGLLQAYVLKEDCEQ